MGRSDMRFCALVQEMGRTARRKILRMLFFKLFLLIMYLNESHNRPEY